MLEMLDYPFMRNALYAGLLASVAFGVVGSYVVVRRIVSISGGISHASFGGVGLATFMGWNPILGAAVFALAAALGIGLVSERRVEKEDTAIGNVWALGMALGAFFIRITPGYPPNPASYLFGNILMVGQLDLYLLAGLAAVAVLTALLLFPRIQAVAFDQEYSRTMGLRTLALNLYMLSLVALSIVFLIKFLGIILVIAMLAIPASIVIHFTHDLRRVMLLSTLVSAVLTIGGLWLAYLWDFEPGPTIVLVSGVAYLIVFLLRKLADLDNRKEGKAGAKA